MKRWHKGLKLFAVVLAFLLAVPINAVESLAAASSTEIKHKSPEDYIPGFRINLDAEINDDAGILISRCYFKAKKDKSFVFVDMVPKGNPAHQATLPAPWLNSEAIDYVFVIINKEKKVTRSQVFTMKERETKEAATWKEPGEVKEIRVDMAQETIEEYETIKKELKENHASELPAWQQVGALEQIAVMTELEKASTHLSGFYDNIVLRDVPISQKYGPLADDLFTGPQIAAAGGLTAITNATGATSAGQVKAAGGISKGWFALGAVAIGAAAIAAAAGAGGGGSGGDGGGGSSGGPVDVDVASESDFVGTYLATDPTRTSYQWHSDLTFNSGGTGSFTQTVDGQQNSGSLIWSFNESTKTLFFRTEYGAEFSGVVTGNTYNFSMSGVWAVTGNPATINMSRQ